MERIGKGMWVIFWCLALIGLVYFFQDKIDQQINPNEQIQSTITAQGRSSITLHQNRMGHYIATGTINNVPVTFLLDTGATQISIPAHLQQQLNLQSGRKQTVHTANGTVTVSSTQIEHLSLGNIEFYNLTANLNPGMTNNTILLGMNALKQLELVQRNNTLTLTQ
ncbi:TIGR02281 family clan AA aspartic protease [Alteromonadales bacterium alter-6D02]|nr:TIGR02281 family clan AA aspartic protease [Alteromonadales bacterium alter-6D02]